MKRRITAIVMAFVMVFSVMGMNTAKAEAATKTSYVLVGQANWVYKVREKVGNYYVWIDVNEKTGDQKLKSTQNLGVNERVLKTVSGWLSASFARQDTFLLPGKDFHLSRPRPETECSLSAGIGSRTVPLPALQSY